MKTTEEERAGLLARAIAIESAASALHVLIQNEAPEADLARRIEELDRAFDAFDLERVSYGRAVDATLESWGRDVGLEWMPAPDELRET